MNHYWSVNFNSTSSLLGGAVVAGMGDNTSIFYNPATITEMETGSNLSFTSSLFTWNTYTFKNMLGDGTKLKSDNFNAQPPFVSFAYKPKIGNINLAAVILTRTKEDFELSWNTSTYYDVLKNLPGNEKYDANFKYRNYYNDTWVGLAMAQKISSKFSYGFTLFISGATLKYNFEYGAFAYSVNDTLDAELYPQSTRIAEGTYEESFKFTEYRVIIKGGLSYNSGPWKFGFNVTTPSLHVFSSGNEASRTQLNSNISISTTEFLPDFIIHDAQEKSKLDTKFKLPFSLSFGFIRNLGSSDSRIYFSTEYYGKIKAYEMIDAEENTDIALPYIYDALDNKDWLSFATSTRSFVNVVVGYSWKIRENLEFLNSIRTDLSSIRNADLAPYDTYNQQKTSDYNIYHYSAGWKFKIKKNSFIAGGQVSLGYSKDEKQVTNFTSPIEINIADNRVLQGSLLPNMDIIYWGFNVYIGITLNFLKNGK
ncbi:MAG: hypothetical protein KQH67_04260 [Bacteroidetes bacterium]|nr:hypothetical protein [Bacteroidota bacterium]